MALNEQELHALAHLRLDRAMTQAYLDMHDEIEIAPVGTVLKSVDRFNSATHPELHEGIGQCFDPEQGSLGVTMEKISDTEIALNSEFNGASDVLDIAESRGQLLEMVGSQEMQLAVFALMSGLDAEEVH